MYTRVAVLASVFAFMATPPAGASQPDQRPPGAAPGQLGGEFVPQAGYLRALQLLRLRRAVPSGPFALAPGLNLAISGTRSIPVICVEFANRAHRFEVADHQQVLFDPAGPRPTPPLPTLTQYYRDISNGRFVPTGQVMGWFQLPQNDAFYEGNNNGLNERLGELLTFGLQQADVLVDFGQFDNDGPDGLPNSGDDDGIVDTVFFVHPETGGECTNGAGGNIWSHSFQYSNFAAHNGQPFRTNDVRRDAQGQAVLGPGGVPARIRVEDYTIQPGLDCGSTSLQPRIIPIGVFCHEYGHALGLPDLYDRTPQNGADSRGIGRYCLMAGGSYGADGAHSDTPVHMSAWCKAVLGWAQLERIASNSTLTFEPVQERNLVFNFDVPGTNGKEFFLVEFRDRNWTDPTGSRMNWDRGFNPGGLAIWHVDEQVGSNSPAWPFAPADQGQNDAPSRRRTPPGFRTPHSLLSLIQADGRVDLEENANSADPDDLFQTGASFADDPQALIGSRGFSGNPSGISLKGVNLAMRIGLARIDDFPPNFTPIAMAPAAPLAPLLSGATLEQLAPMVAPQQAEVAKSLQAIDRKLSFAAAEQLDEQDQELLKKLPPEQIRQGIAAERSQKALRIAAEARTKEVAATAPAAANSAERSIQQLLQQSQGERTATARFSPSLDRIERITQLNIPTGGLAPLDDAKQRLQADQILKSLIGPNVELTPMEGPAAGDASVRFAQVITVDGKKLPLSCNGVSFYYKEGTLSAVDSNVIATEGLQVTGTPDGLSADQAKELISKQLRLEPSLISYAQQCVYLVGGDRGRVAMKVNVKSGGKRPDVEVFVDTETRQILDIK